MDLHEVMQYIYETFDKSLPRLGPGDDASTRKALSLLFSTQQPQTGKFGPEGIRILDIGCGNGAQTIQLAKCTNGIITAVDNHQPYLDELQRRSEAEGLSERIKPYLLDMTSMGMEKESFDLIWAEGSLYNMGFREALQVCHDLLVPSGFLGASELCWFRPDPPPECRKFFTDMYPAMVDIAANLDAFKSSGFLVLDHFTLPESAWLETYYSPIEERLKILREHHSDDEKRMEFIETVQLEIDIYRKYSDYYGYIFCLAERS